jgi:hypothetical protein
MIAQLVYVSMRGSNCNETEIEKILIHSRKSNLHLDISGVLLYTDSKFLQLLEGEAKTVMNLYKSINLDVRHGQVKLVSVTPIKERSFSSWQMGARKITGSEIDFKTDVSQGDLIAFKDLLYGNTRDGSSISTLIKKIF